MGNLNFIYSFGYEYESTHTGMICYLCDLWNSGNKVPLESFLYTILGFDSLKNITKIDTQKEYYKINRADLVIRNVSEDTKTPVPLLVIEMKTTSESSSNQIDAYLNAENLDEKTIILWITIGGISEYNNGHLQKRLGQKLKHIKTFDIYQALENIPTNTDYLLTQWKNSIKEDLEVRDIPGSDNKNDRNFEYFSEKIVSTSHKNQDPGTYWNLYFLDSLLESIKANLEFSSLQKHYGLVARPSIYPAGMKPDTILNFWWDKENEPIYFEINDNGKLNLKYASGSKDQIDLTDLKAELKRIFLIFHPKEGGRTGGRTRILFSFDVGIKIEKVNGVRIFTFAEGKNTTVDKIIKILQKYLNVYQTSI